MIYHIFIMQTKKSRKFGYNANFGYIFIMQPTESDKFEKNANDLSYFHNANYEK